MNQRPSWMARLPQPVAARDGGGARGRPQRLATPSAPTGVGLASERTRSMMVAGLQRLGVRDAQVLEAIDRVPRHQFVELGFASRAYEDVALPIGHGQTISKPSTVARMIELAVAHVPLAQRKQLVALEIGTGCGYQAAVMAQVFGQVISIERVRGLHEAARANLRSLRLPNLRLVFGDGHLGVQEASPYDAILVAAAGDTIPPALMNQMRVGARLVAPVVRQGLQALHLVERFSDSEWQSTVLDAVRFVPLRTGTT